MATKHTGAIHTRVLSQNQYIRKFHETVDSFIGRNHWQVYTDFLQLMMDSFLSDQTPDHPREKDYMDIVRQYKPHEPEKFMQMMNCIFAYMRETNRECISELWEEYASNSMIGPIRPIRPIKKMKESKRKMETKFTDGQFMDAFNERQHEAYTIAKEHGFHERNIPDTEFIALIHSELSEALQALRNGNPPDPHMSEFSSLEIELKEKR